MGKTYTIPAGQRTKIYRLFSSSIPSAVQFEARAEGAVSGRIEVDRWHWFSWKKETLPLQSQNAVAKGFADADFVIHVTPDHDCEVVIGKKSAGGALVLIVLLALVIVALAVAGFVGTLPPPE